MVAFERAGGIKNKILDTGAAPNVAKETCAVIRASVHITFDNSVALAVKSSTVRVSGITDGGVVGFCVEGDVGRQLGVQIRRATVHLRSEPLHVVSCAEQIVAFAILCRLALSSQIRAASYEKRSGHEKMLESHFVFN